jgi:Fe-S-cluster containining protein
MHLSDEFYSEQGLAFSCTQCGACCKAKSGHLFLTALDLRRLAEHLELSDDEFFLQYCEVVELDLAARISLVAEDDGSCVFLGRQGCEVYEQRPLQCRTYPFWSTNLLDREAWQSTCEACAGAGQGKLWSPQEIGECVEQRENEPLLDVGGDD